MKIADDTFDRTLYAMINCHLKCIYSNQGLGEEFGYTFQSVKQLTNFARKLANQTIFKCWSSPTGRWGMATAIKYVKHTSNSDW